MHLNEKYSPKLYNEIIQTIMMFVKSTKGLYDLKGETAHKYTFTVKNNEFDFAKGKVSYEVLIFREKNSSLVTDANAGKDKPHLQFLIQIDPDYEPQAYRELYMRLTDDVRHEIEHLIQHQFRPSIFTPQDERDAINRDPERTHEYFIMPEEIEAMCAGFYNRAKRQKVNVDTIMKNYLDFYLNEKFITKSQFDKTLEVWLTYMKKRFPMAHYEQIKENFEIPTLFEHINEKLKQPIPGKSINVFDLDDTVITTSAKIKVFNPITKDSFELTPAEYNFYKKEKHHKIDFSDFDDIDILRKGQLIDWVVDILKKTMLKQKAVAIVTARSADVGILKSFLKENGMNIHTDLIMPVSNPRLGFTGSVAERKKQAFERLHEMGYENFKFFDDNEDNLKEVKNLESELGITVELRHIQPKWVPSLVESMEGRLLEAVTGDETKYWALYAHISDFFYPAKNADDLMNLFNKAAKKPDKAWPIEVLRYFYEWHLNRIKDSKRIEKAKVLANESKQYYEKISRSSNNISE